jgi:O-antigen/teichoic acid export membrane protein
MTLAAKKFKADVLSGTVGTVVAYVIGLLFLPIITYYYKPEHIGAWQILLASINLISPLSTLLFENAIILERSRKVISQLLTIVMYNSLCIGFLFVLVILCFNSTFVGLMRIQNLPINAGRLLLIGVWAQVSFVIFSALIVRQKKFKEQAISKVIGACVIPLVAVVLAITLGANSISYVIAALSGFVIQVIFLFGSIDKRYFSNVYYWDKEKVFHTVKKYKVYPIYMVPYALSQSAVWQITLMSLGLLFSTSIVGAYTVARQLVFMPVSLLTASLKQVLFSYASSVPKYDKSINNRIEMILVNIINIAIPFAVFGFFYLPESINFALGKSWNNVGIFSQWIIIPAISLMLTSWLDRMLDVYSKQRLAVCLQITSDVIMLLVLLICFLLKANSLTTVISLSVYLAIYNLIWLFVVLDIIGFAPSFWLRIVARLFCITVISISMIKGLEVFLPFSTAIIIELLLLSVLVYYLYTKYRVRT